MTKLARKEADHVSSHWQRVTWEKISEFGSQNHFQKSGIRNINLSLSNQTTAEDEEGKEEGEGPEESIAEAKHDFEVLFAVVWICLNEMSRICFLGILFLLIYIL